MSKYGDLLLTPQERASKALAASRAEAQNRVTTYVKRLEELEQQGAQVEKRRDALHDAIEGFVTKGKANPLLDKFRTISDARVALDKLRQEYREIDREHTNLLQQAERAADMRDEVYLAGPEPEFNPATFAAEWYAGSRNHASQKDDRIVVRVPDPEHQAVIDQVIGR